MKIKPYFNFLTIVGISSAIMTVGLTTVLSTKGNAIMFPILMISISVFAICLGILNVRRESKQTFQKIDE